MTQFSGVWRIIETDVWDVDALEMVGPALLSFGADGLGDLTMIAIEADVDYRVDDRSAGLCEFSFAGADDGSPVSGRGWAGIDGDRLRGKLLFHRGDETTFVAVRRTD